MCTKRQSAAYARAATPSLKMVEWGKISSRRRHLISFRLLPCIPCQPTASLSGPPSILHYKRPFICIQHAVTPLYGSGNVCARLCSVYPRRGREGGGGSRYKKAGPLFHPRAWLVRRRLYIRGTEGFNKMAKLCPLVQPRVFQTRENYSMILL